MQRRPVYSSGKAAHNHCHQPARLITHLKDQFAFLLVLVLSTTPVLAYSDDTSAQVRVKSSQRTSGPYSGVYLLFPCSSAFMRQAVTSYCLRISAEAFVNDACQGDRDTCPVTAAGFANERSVARQTQRDLSRRGMALMSEPLPEPFDPFETAGAQLAADLGAIQCVICKWCQGAAVEYC